MAEKLVNSFHLSPPTSSCPLQSRSLVEEALDHSILSQSVASTDMAMVSNASQPSAPAALEAPASCSTSAPSAKGVYHPPRAIAVELPDFLKPQPRAIPSEAPASDSTAESAPAPTAVPWVRRVSKAEASPSWRNDKEFVKVENKHHGHHGLVAATARVSPQALSAATSDFESEPKAPKSVRALANPFCLLGAMAGEEEEEGMMGPSFA